MCGTCDHGAGPGNPHKLCSGKCGHEGDCQKGAALDPRPPQGRGGAHHGLRTADVPKRPAATFDLGDESNIRIPRGADGDPLSIEQRLRLVELKLGGSINWAKNPFFGLTVEPGSGCLNKSSLCNSGRPLDIHFEKCAPGLFDHPICLADIPWEPSSFGVARPPCVVYDFGVRAQPQFGMALASVVGCEVHAFDPSPVSVAWYREARNQGDIPPNYHFHPFGAGGLDGFVELAEYNWGQVSILRIPSLMKNCSGVPPDDRLFTSACQTRYVPHKSFRLKVHTLGTIMRQLKHERVDILKVDVEGSEHAFLKDAVDTGAMHAVEQLALEWHHYPFDPIYGAGSSPPLNALVSVLAAMGLRCWHVHDGEGWPSSEAVYHFNHMHDVRYNSASFRRVRRSV